MKKVTTTNKKNQRQAATAFGIAAFNLWQSNRQAADDVGFTSTSTVDIDNRACPSTGALYTLATVVAARDHQGNQAAGGSSDKFARLLHQFHATARRWTRANEAGRNLDNWPRRPRRGRNILNDANQLRKLAANHCRSPSTSPLPAAGSCSTTDGMVPTVARQFKLLFLVIVSLLSTIGAIGAPGISTDFPVRACDANSTRTQLLRRWPRNVAQPEQWKDRVGHFRKKN